MLVFVRGGSGRDGRRRNDREGLGLRTPGMLPLSIAREEGENNQDAEHDL